MCGPPDPEMRRAASPKAARKSQSNLHIDENSKPSPAIQVARRHREKLSPSIERAILRRSESEKPAGVVVNKLTGARAEG